MTNGWRRTITDCKSLFDCLAKDASVPEDRRTALIVESLRERCSVGVRRDQKRSGEYESLEEETTHQHFGRSSGRLSGANGWIFSRKIGGSEDTTRASPAQNPSLSTF